MRIGFFSTHAFDRQFFDEANGRAQSIASELAASRSAYSCRKSATIVGGRSASFSPDSTEYDATVPVQSPPTATDS